MSGEEALLVHTVELRGRMVLKGLVLGRQMGVLGGEVGLHGRVPDHAGSAPRPGRGDTLRSNIVPGEAAIRAAQDESAPLYG